MRAASGANPRPSPASTTVPTFLLPLPSPAAPTFAPTVTTGTPRSTRGVQKEEEEEEEEEEAILLLLHQSLAQRCVRTHPHGHHHRQKRRSAPGKRRPPGGRSEGEAAGGGGAGLGRESARLPASQRPHPPPPPGKEAGRPRPLVVRPSTPRGPGGWPAAPRRTASTCCSRASGRSRAARRTRPRSSSGAWPPPRPPRPSGQRSRTSGPGRCSLCRSPASAASCPASTPRRAADLGSRRRWSTWACTAAPPSSGSRCVRRHGSRAGP